jgi:hypothetical protein
MGGPAVGPAELTYNELHYHQLKGRPATVFMDELLEQHRDAQISYDRSCGDRLAFITHGPATMHGTRKPLPYTDAAFNSALKAFPKGLHGFLEDEDDRQLRTVQAFDLSSAMTLLGQVHASLAHADTLVMTYFGLMHPKFIRALDYYNAHVLLVTGSMLDRWLVRRDLGEVDLSSLKAVGVSDGQVPPERMEAYREFFRAHGYKYDIVAGCAMSEADGQSLLAPGGDKDEAYGRASDSDNACLGDQGDDQSGARRTGRTGCVDGMDGDTPPAGMGSHAAYTVFDALAGVPPTLPLGIDPARFDPLAPWKMLMPERKHNAREMPEIPPAIMNVVLKYGNRLAGIPNGRRQISYDFES